MSTDPASFDDSVESDHPYTIDVIAMLAGVDTTTVVRYHEQGLLRPAESGSGGEPVFDAETLRCLRRMEHLRETCGVNEAGLRLILGLLEELEQLRAERRRMTR